MPFPPARKGDPFTADLYNSDLSPLDRMRVAGADVIPPPPSPVFAQTPGLWCELVQEFNDYLEVKLLNGSTEDKAATRTYIAKPWKLQHNVNHYGSITSLATTNAHEVDVDDGGGGEDAETWVVRPSYEVGDTLFAIYTTGTGVSVDGEPLALSDANADGRAWALEAS